MPNTIEATITQKTGIVYVERMGERLSLEVGDSIYEQDLILTGPDTVAEIQYRDGTRSRLAPDTEMKLLDFEYGITADSENSFLVDLNHGSMRTVTGDIVKLNPHGFVITADDVVVNVLGSDALFSVRGNQVFVGSSFTSVGVEVQLPDLEPYMLGSLQSIAFSSLTNVPILQTYSSTAELQNVYLGISPPLAWSVPMYSQEELKFMDQSPIAADTITIGDSSNSVDAQVQIFPLGAHSASSNILLMQTGLSEDALLNPSFNLSDIQIPSNPDIVSGQFANPSLIYPGINSSNLNNETIEGPDTFYTTFDEKDSPLNMTEGDDWVQIGHMLGGIVNLLGGNDLIEVSAMGPDAAQIKPVVFSRSGLSFGDLESDLKPAIHGGNGNDTISIGEMTQGTIYGGNGNDVVSISKLSGLNFIDLGDGNDVLSAFIEDSTVSLSGNVLGGEGTDVLITNQTGIATELEVVITYTGASSADDLKLENFNVRVNDDGSVTLGQGWKEDVGGLVHEPSGATMTHSYVTIHEDPTLVTRSASTMTMSMSESSFAIPLAQEADPIQDAYNATMSQNAIL